jgi:hypothetical protein
VQVGLLDAALLPVAAAEQAKRLLDPTHPANEMIYRSRWNPRQWRVEKFSGKDADRAASLYVTVGQIAFRQFLPSQRFTDARVTARGLFISKAIAGYRRLSLCGGAGAPGPARALVVKLFLKL